MSTIKNAPEKKRLSLQKERRNRYGENSKSSRKNIPRSKQLQHMDERRKVTALLGRLTGTVDEDEAAHTELLAKNKVSDSRWHGFKKRPDTPLIEVIAAKRKKASS